MSIEFIDNSEAVKAALEQGIIAGLEEAAGEIESATKRNTRVKSGNTKGSWKHKVVDSELTAYIGSNAENAIWEEFGTGERAIPEGLYLYKKFSYSVNCTRNRTSNEKIALFFTFHIPFKGKGAAVCRPLFFCGSMLSYVCNLSLAQRK